MGSQRREDAVLRCGQTNPARSTYGPFSRCHPATVVFEAIGFGAVRVLLPPPDPRGDASLFIPTNVDIPPSANTSAAAVVGLSGRLHHDSLGCFESHTKPARGA